MTTLRIPGVNLIDAATAENTPENYGLYGHLTVGKTQLAADAALYYQAQGKKVIYVATPDEDPYTTLKGFNLGNIIAPVDTALDFEKLMKGIKAAKVDVCILDSVKGLNRLSMDKMLGGKGKYPVDNKEWSPVHAAFVGIMTLFTSSTPISIFLCPADRSSDSFVNPGQQKPNLITCDLPGKMAAGIRGSVSYMGYITSELDESTKTFKREISFVPSRSILTLARGLTKQMVEPIPLVEGVSGNWQRIQEAFEAHRGVAEEPVAEDVSE